MPSKRYNTEGIIHKLREADVSSQPGAATPARYASSSGCQSKTYYRWRKLYGGMKVAQAKRLKALDAENARLRRAVADLTVDKQSLKEVAEGNY